MSRNKTNPRRRPATQADVAKAKAQATDEAMTRILQIVMYVLVDKHSATHEEIGQLAAEVNYVADSINRKYLTFADIESTLGDEYDVHLDLR